MEVLTIVHRRCQVAATPAFPAAADGKPARVAAANGSSVG
jgi:hypothetical protein